MALDTEVMMIVIIAECTELGKMATMVRLIVMMAAARRASTLVKVVMILRAAVEDTQARVTKPQRWARCQ